MAGTASAQVDGVDDNSSLTQQATELVMPFDNSYNRASYLLVSNPFASSGAIAAVSTHWTFWGADCQELANLSMCLTTNDTIVVDPTNMTAIGADNKPVGPTVNLSGSRGIVTVTAYQTDKDCNPWDETGRQLAQEALVGTFTIADLTYGYSFGNDALGLFSQNNQVQLPSGDVTRYVLQTLNPTTAPGVEAGSLVITSWLTIDKNGLAVPSDEGEEFWLTHHDNLEIATSLPDVTVGCVEFNTIASAGKQPLIPNYVTINSSGILSMWPKEPSDGFLFGLIGQAIGNFGASSRAKIDYARD
ncbi:MAG: hypothetical protein ACKO2K_05025 [Alphaproteobacteria bacterium]